MRGVGAKRDHGQLVGFEVLKDFILERLEQLARLRIVLQPIFVEPILPFVPVEHLVQREHEVLVFELRRGEVEVDLPVKVRLDPPILRHGDDGVLPVLGRFHSLSDVDVEPALHELETRCHRLHHLAAQAGLVERGHALLAVEQELVGCAISNCRIRSLDRPTRERIGRVLLDLERHQCADGKGLRDRRDQPFDALLVPDPAALEVGQLDLAVSALAQELFEADRVGLECRLLTQSHTPRMFLLAFGQGSVVSGHTLSCRGLPSTAY